MTLSSSRLRGEERQEGDVLSRVEARRLLPGTDHNKADFVNLIGARDKYL